MKRAVLLILVLLAFLWVLDVFFLGNTIKEPKNTLQITPSPTLAPTDSVVLNQNTQQVLVTKVIDGDTIVISTGQTVRYIGIDTPETKDPRRGVQCFGNEAYLKNKELVEGKMVRLEKDVSETDKYGRLLRYVYLDNLFVNEYLVQKGYAYASSYPPDIKYQEILQIAQKIAREKQLGLWRICTLPTPVASVSEDKDCSDFSTQVESQAFFESEGGPSIDSHKLDVDKDGKACEGLP